MIDLFNETLHSWQTFYSTVGAASAALIGLMFVALSLGMHLINETTKEAFDVFATPNVFYFVTALVLSGVMLVPAYEPPIFTGVIVVGGLAAAVNAWFHTWALFRSGQRNQDFNRWDWFSLVILPSISYALLPIAGIFCALDRWPAAFTILWIATLLILICGIAGTWGLVIWIIYQRRE